MIVVSMCVVRVAKMPLKAFHNQMKRADNP